MPTLEGNGDNDSSSVTNITPTQAAAEDATAAPSAVAAPQLQRLSKIIASSGLCSRRMAEQWIGEGRVRVNYDRYISH
jgi:hypothetical protein